MDKKDAENQDTFDISHFLTLMNNEVGKLKNLPVHPHII
jgi:serine/threonine protein kinase